MAIDDSTHSRVVAFLKIVLPLTALALLSTLFLVARAVDPAQKLPFADVDVDEIARKQRIGKPNFSGVTSDGTAIALSAETALPETDDPKNVTGETVQADIDLPNGENIVISAGRMKVNYSKAEVALLDTVEIVSASGYKMRTEKIEMALDTTSIRSDTPTTLSGAIGQLSADRFALTAKDESNTNYVLVFKGSVKLIYKPGE